MNLKEIKDIIKSSDKILVGAGAGMSIPAGIDLMDEKAFAENYPAMVKYGFSFAYQLMGYPYEDDRLRWGYLSASLNDMNKLGIDETYQNLLKLLKDKDYFILTTNVDRLFYKNGFDKDKIYTPQGDSFLFQCKEPCHDEVWDARPLIEEMVKHVDPATQYLTREDLLPKCPVCGGDVYMNVRSGSFYIDDHYQEQRDRLNKWLNDNIDKHIVLLEIGVGFNTPGVIRYPFEELLKQLPNVSLIRINPSHSRVPENAYSLEMNIEEALDKLMA
ncbi:NAD-dependent protein deacetylase of SIR2 family [Acidaminobacter sp. JC074]|uniref:Sir2 silent information regulator family NAD-dependent deacetylase n=1 Tax=Acidaminobacter sp. JC074 TaxID=2530199 RepID=UPI001F0D51FE|nr:Sir2 silent information regulator family NAD-dependent deacetylase [Acidaminobacter sp. JC074]MCH4889231.1 NAD-dependent protein deacetylase of SIR2 family [Acidaminobacter sp. JC074]